MKKKVYENAAAALDGLLFDGMTIAAGGFGLCGIPELLIAAIRDAGDEGPHRRLEQRRRRRLRARRPAADRQVKKMISSYVGENAEFMRQYLCGRARARVQPAGHAGRADARRRRRHPGLLHQDRRRHGDRRGQGAQGVRRRDLHPRARHRRRPRRSSRPGRATSRATSSTARPRATSIRTPPPAARSASPRSRRSCRSARSTPTASTRPASSCTASCRASTRSASSSAPSARPEDGGVQRRRRRYRRAPERLPTTAAVRAAAGAGADQPGVRGQPDRLRQRRPSPD